MSRSPTRFRGDRTSRWLRLFIAVACLQPRDVRSCTNLLVTPGASLDGSALIAYNADSPTLMGMLYHYPPVAVHNSSSTRRRIHDWDTGRYLGTIDLAPLLRNHSAAATYNVVGNANERGLVIAETTFGGTPRLAWNQTQGRVDYGSLIYLALQYTATCREAIRFMARLLDAYGYASGGESFSLADATTGEVWLMELISRGDDYNGKLGVVWVGVRVPDGSVAAHANHARITTFPRDDPENCMYAEDVVDVAVHYGLYASTADPLAFSFSDVYDPRNFLNVRQGEARVWALFSPIADEHGGFQAKHLRYAMGEHTNERMPLYITPFRKLSLTDVMSLMSSHYEDTPLDPTVDIGSGLFASPYRPRPLVWTFHNRTYHNERSIATPKTGWNFVATVRPWLPPVLAAVLWFGCDDSSTAPRVPVYAASRRVPAPYAGRGPQDGVPSPLLRFNLDKAFWVQNMVSNLVYGRWSEAYPVLQRRLQQVTQDFLERVSLTDQLAMDAYRIKGIDDAVDQVTRFSVQAGATLHQQWKEFYGELFVKFRDFYTISAATDKPDCNCVANEPGMSERVKQRIVTETSDRYRVPDMATSLNRDDAANYQSVM